MVGSSKNFRVFDCLSVDFYPEYLNHAAVLFHFNFHRICVVLTSTRAAESALCHRAGIGGTEGLRYEDEADGTVRWSMEENVTSFRENFHEVTFKVVVPRSCVSRLSVPRFRYSKDLQSG